MYKWYRKMRCFSRERDFVENLLQEAGIGLIAWDHLYIQAKVENKINQNKTYIFKPRGILDRGPLTPPPPDPSLFRQIDIKWFICILIISISCLRNDVGWAESPSQVGRLYGAGGLTVQIMTQTDRPIHFGYNEFTLWKMFFFNLLGPIIFFIIR